jgi:AmmeMemoRadiSam system protein A
LRTLAGELRGCVGHVEPAYRTLADEVAACAVAAATRDSRFFPVQLSELAGLRIELSLLGAPEPISGVEQLDPARYGVLVAAGTRRGVLLPDIEGVTTAGEQLRIARRKAGIAPGAQVALARFEVQKLSEDVPHDEDGHGRA